MATSLKSLRTSLAQNREKKGRLEEQLRVEREAVRRHESDIEKNRDFTYTVDEQFIKKEPTKPGQYVVNCITCNMTCYENWPFPNDEDKRKCPAMDNNGYCKVCPIKCRWDMHRNQSYVYVVKTHTVTKPSLDLKRKYEEAMQKKAEAEILVARRINELEKVNSEICAAERKLVGGFLHFFCSFINILSNLTLLYTSNFRRFWNPTTTTYCTFSTIVCRAKQSLMSAIFWKCQRRSRMRPNEQSSD